MAQLQFFRLVLLLAIGISISTLVGGVPFPNDILGEPAVQCGQGTIHLSVNTSRDVPSRIFAKGHYDLEGCFFESAKAGSFDFGKCNMNRQREINPRGMAYTLTVVVQLHPLFITKVDRAYHIRCFYMEADKAVSIDLGVSEMATEVLESAHAMPQCMYGLHTEGPNGPMARFARVGDKLWHVWDCPSDVYGMLVHSCFVLDGQSNKVLIVDENGCGVDDYVMQTPQYSSDMTRAQQETHVFKFADRITVAFNCQIRLCFKNDDACKGVTPPTCDANGRRPSTISNQGGEGISTSNPGGKNSSNIVPASSNNNTSPSEASTSTLPSTTLAENVTSAVTPPTVISEVPGNKSAGGLDDDLTSDELITTTTQASSTLPIGVTTTNSIDTNVIAQSSTTTPGNTVETNSATTSGFLATDLNELIGILTTVQPTNDTFPTPGDLKAFARKSDFDTRTLKSAETETETEKPPSALERLEKLEPEEGSGEETRRPTDDPATLTIDPALIADADQLLLEPRGRRNVVKPRLRDIPIVSGRDVLDLDINSELTVLERDDAPPNAFSGDRRAAAQQLEQSPTEMGDRPNVCISALGFALLISTALFSVIVCATAIFIGAIRTRKGAKITALIRSVDTRPMSF